MKIRKWIGYIFILLVFIFGIYIGWWLVFLKPLITIVATTALSWSSLGICVLRFFGGDIVGDLIWLAGYVIYELAFAD